MNAVVRLGEWVAGITGWRRLLFAAAMGAFSATAFAPLYFFPALLLGFAALALQLDGADLHPRPVRTAALVGWAFAFGQFVVGLHWIGFAFLIDPGAHLWQLPFAILGLSAFLALFGALSCALAIFFWRNTRGRLILLAMFLAVGEWLRGHILTGFPWNLQAYGWGASLAVLQSASLVGAYGLSFLTILLGVSLAEVARRRMMLPAAMAMVFVALWGFGAARLALTPVSDVPGVRLRLVQPDIPQREVHDRSLLARNWQRLLDLSARPGAPTHIIWPESAAPFALARSPTALDTIAVLTGRDKVLFTGAERVEEDADGPSYYNSLYLFGPGGAPLGVYNKSHLVPFGEYVPYASLLNSIGITKLTAGESGFSSGAGPALYPVPGAPAMTPLICYEVIFPGAVTAKAGRPGWFVNVTDDSWFGPWAGPYQHLLIARVRAIEEGVPIARAANTGVSAVIDPLGRIKAKLDLGRLGVVDAGLPKAVAPTLYARFGDLGFWLLLLAAALAGEAGFWLFPLVSAGLANVKRR